MIEINPKKAYSIAGIEVNGRKMISIRQMYRTRDDPNWKPGKNGVSIDIEVLPELVAKFTEILAADNFEPLNLK